jgi:hypothetical protein
METLKTHHSIKMAIRKGSAAAKELFESSDLARWASYLSRYDEAWVSRAIAKQARTLMAERRLNDVQELHTLVSNVIRDNVNSRMPAPFATKDELAIITMWKMLRGEWRARNYNFVIDLREEEVVTATREALEAARNMSDASSFAGPIERLSKLKGIGPATAAAFLNHFDEKGFFPCMSDEAMDVLLPKREYTPKAYKILHRELSKKAVMLGSEWTASSVEKAMWAAAMTSSADPTSTTTTTTSSSTTTAPTSDDELKVAKKRKIAS